MLRTGLEELLLTMGESGLRRGVLLTGGSGYVGGLIAASLLMHDDVEIVAPVRGSTDIEKFLAPIRAEVEMSDERLDEAMAARIHVVQLPAFDSLADLDPLIAQYNVREIIHSAGCLDYFNAGALENVNVNFTRALVAQAGRWNVERFIYISTAFSKIESD